MSFAADEQPRMLDSASRVVAISAAGDSVKVEVSWTSPGDDGNVGTAAEYDFRYSVDSVVLVNWTNAVQVTGEPVPLIAGTRQVDTFYIPNPSIRPVYVAVKARDEAYNWSGMSNILKVLDITPPAAITDLRGTP